MASHFLNSSSPVEYNDDYDYDNFSDYEEDYDDSYAFKPIFSDYEDSFEANLKFIRENSNSPMTEEEKQEMIAHGKQYVEANNLFDLSIKDLNLQDLAEKVDFEKVWQFNPQREREVDFSFPQLMASNARKDFREIRSEIGNNVFKQNFDKKQNCKFLDPDISRLIRMKQKENLSLNVQQALEVIRLDTKCFQYLFDKGFDKFFSKAKVFTRNMKMESTIDPNSELYKVVNFDDTKFSIPLKLVPFISVAYCPSGGGKTTQFSNKKKFKDVDKFVEDNYELFQQIQKLSVKFKSPDYMNLFFKYCIVKDLDNLFCKILVMNHPNQVPNVLRHKFNELIIIPKRFRWRTRFFSENLFSLLGCINYRKVVLDYKDYVSFTERYFHYTDSYESIRIFFEQLKGDHSTFIPRLKDHIKKKKQLTEEDDFVIRDSDLETNWHFL